MIFKDNSDISIGQLCWHGELTRVARVAEIVSCESKKNEFGVDNFGVFLCENMLSENLCYDIFLPDVTFFEEDFVPLTGLEKMIVFEIKSDVRKYITERSLAYTYMSIQRENRSSADKIRWVASMGSPPNFPEEQKEYWYKGR